MRFRLICCAASMAITLMPRVALAANCADEISRMMSRDTEKLTTRYQKVTRQIQDRGSSPRLVQEECRVARELRPRLEDQLAALKQSGCAKDPQVGSMVADIVRGHESDLAMAKATAARSECH